MQENDRGNLVSQGTCITRRNSAASSDHPLRIGLPYVSCRGPSERNLQKSVGYQSPSRPTHTRTPAQVEAVRGHGLLNFRTRSTCRSTEVAEPFRVLSVGVQDDLEGTVNSPEDNHVPAVETGSFLAPQEKKRKRLRREKRESGFELMRFLSKSRKKESIDSHPSLTFEYEQTPKKVLISIPVPSMERSHSLFCEATTHHCESRKQRKKPKVWSVRESIRKCINWAEGARMGRPGIYLRRDRQVADSLVDVHESLYRPRSVRKPIRLL